MNKDDITRMAREVKIECDLIDEDEGQVWYITTETLERFFHAAYAAGAAAELRRLLDRRLRTSAIETQTLTRGTQPPQSAQGE